MDQYILWCLILILLFVLVVILKKKNYLKESFQDDLSSVQSNSTATSNSTSNLSNAPVAANATPPLALVNRTIPAVANPVNSLPATNEIIAAPKDKQPVIVEGTPAQMGLIFGYLPNTGKGDMDDLEETKNPNVIYSRDSINIFTNNSYFGYSSNNPLFPNLLEKLGSFNPYIYQTIKIHIKNDLFKKLDVLEDISTNETVPIVYTQSIVCFTVKYLQDNYFLQYVPNTNTFYLTDTPSFFILLKSTDTTNKKQALYGDSIIFKCLDNSQYIVSYDKILLTEPDKSSSFIIKRGELKDVCTNFYNDKNVDMTKFLPQYILDSTKEKEIINKYNAETEEYISKLKKSTSDKIKLIQDSIIVLEGKLNNANSTLEIELQSKRVEYQSKIEQMKKKLDNDMAEYKRQKMEEYNSKKKKNRNRQIC